MCHRGSSNNGLTCTTWKNNNARASMPETFCGMFLTGLFLAGFASKTKQY